MFKIFKGLPLSSVLKPASWYSTGALDFPC